MIIAKIIIIWHLKIMFETAPPPKKKNTLAALILRFHPKEYSGTAPVLEIYVTFTIFSTLRTLVIYS
jgi:hypothetical protein